MMNLGYTAQALPAMPNGPDAYSAAALKAKASSGGAQGDQFLAGLIKNMVGGTGVPTQDWQQGGGALGQSIQQMMSPDGLTKYQRSAPAIPAQSVSGVPANMAEDSGVISSIPAVTGAAGAGSAAAGAGGAGLFSSI